MEIANIPKVTYSDQPILTTAQLAEFYGCTTASIQKNFNINKTRFIAGVHYFKVEGKELQKLRTTIGNLQISPMARAFYLWTKKGAARHAKMLSTNKAWEVYEQLEDAYFESKEKVAAVPKKENIVTVQKTDELRVTISPVPKKFSMEF